MKKLLIVATVLFLNIGSNAQSKGIRIGYIDMEYILQNVPNYTEAKNQLEQKAQGWKTELESKQAAIAKLQETLKSEKVLLTKELIDEREEEIKFQETELAEYQQKRFGPNGDLIVQKAILAQPVQDQVFTAVQDISEAKKYDFVFDKSSNLTMLFAAKRYDISDQVIRAITRSEKRKNMTKKEVKVEEETERKLDEAQENPEIGERQKLLDTKKAAREKLLEDKKIAAELRKKDQEEKRQQALAERTAKKNGTVLGNDKTTTDETSPDPKTTTSVVDNSAKEEAKRLLEEKQEAKKADYEARKAALEEKRVKAIADREAAKKELEEKRLKALADKEAARKAKIEGK
jgi:Skp family chaperone for outer membrane proteins